MVTANQCPRCSSKLRYSELGDLFTLKCASCGWEQSGTVSRVFPELQPGTSVQVFVQAPNAEASALELKTLRACSPEAKSLSAQQLQKQLASGALFNVGVFPEYRARELADQLEAAGFRVTSTRR
jgi:hypothetical protein